MPSLFAVLGEPGGGKSSLVAAFAREYLLKSKEKGDVVIPHFVGAAPGSTNIRHTLERLCNELKLVVASFGAPNDNSKNISTDPSEQTGLPSCISFSPISIDPFLYCKHYRG